MDTLISTISYYRSTFLEENGDPFTSTLFGMESPTFFFTLCINIVLFCKVWGPRLMQTRKTVDLRPLYIISNGHGFGVILIGIITGFLNSQYFSDCFDCQAYKPDSFHPSNIMIKMIGYVFIWQKIHDFSVPIFNVLAKREDRVTNLQLFHLFGATMFTWAGAKLNPGGIFITVALADGLYTLLVYAYLIMKAASSELRPTTKNFRTFLFWFRVISVTMLLFHQLYFLFQENCFTLEIRMFSTLYVFLTAVLYPIDWSRRMEKERKMTSDKGSLEKKVNGEVKLCNGLNGTISKIDENGNMMKSIQN